LRSRCCSPRPPSSPPVIHRWSCLIVFFYVYPDDDRLAGIIGSFSGSPLLYTPLVTLTSNFRLGALAFSLFIARARADARRHHRRRHPLLIDVAVFFDVYPYMEQRQPRGSKRCETKVTKVWGSFLIAAEALKTPTRNGYNAQGVNLTFPPRWGVNPSRSRCCSPPPSSSPPVIHRCRCFVLCLLCSHSVALSVFV